MLRCQPNDARRMGYQRRHGLGRKEHLSKDRPLQQRQFVEGWCSNMLIGRRKADLVYKGLELGS